MVQHEDDILLSELLKKEAFQASENRWFTRRVLNRLPSSRQHHWLMPAIYVIAALVCAVSWKSMLTGLDGAVTVRDLLYLVIMAIVTIYFILSAFTTAIRTE